MTHFNMIRYAFLLISIISNVLATTISKQEQSEACIKPKVVIVSMFTPEAEVWYNISEFNLLAQNLTVPGLSPLFPDVHCTEHGTICQVVTGEGEINAASTLSSFVLSPLFDLRLTYFLIAGIAGVSPEIATIGAVTFAKYAVQVALQHELDARSIPENFSTGYFPLGSDAPDQYPVNIYGTEVFELSERLRDVAVGFAKTATLDDTDTAQAYRMRYATEMAFAAGARAPTVVGCDVVTSDNYWSGELLAEAFHNTTQLFTNRSGVYCTTAQEDNATLESLLRSAKANMTDFSRIVLMRTASDFDRAPPGVSDLDNLVYIDQGAFDSSVANIYRAGVKVIEGIISEWETTFKQGIEPTNYIGDILQTLGGNSDFGRPSEFINRRAVDNRARKTALRQKHSLAYRKSV